jgi:hypothetical protein
MFHLMEWLRMLLLHVVWWLLLYVTLEGKPVVVESIPVERTVIDKVAEAA